MFRRQSISMMPLLLRVSLRRRSVVAFSSCNQNKVGIISSTEEETILIKPSSPTPQHLTEFKLSLVDNHMSPVYIPLVFFYNNPAPGSIVEAKRSLDILKSSLAQTLTHFYPLAGRLSKSVDDSIPIVHCNDEGVPFSAATAQGCGGLELFLRRGPPQIDLLHQFLPFPPCMVGKPAYTLESAPQIAFRATVFSCGGFAIGVCLLHKIVDGGVVIDFMKLWASFARRNEQAAAVGDHGAYYAHNRAATSLFPAHRSDVSPSTTVDCVSEEEGGEGKKKVTRRFVFCEEAISELKARARSEWVPNPSRSQAISGLLWSSAVNATAVATSPDGVNPGSVYSVAVMAVDLRSRMKEAWAEYTVGNMLWGAVSLYENHNRRHGCDGNKMAELVWKLKKSVAGVDRKLVEKLEGGGGREEHMRYKEMLGRIMGAAPSGSKSMYFVMSSTLRLGLCNVDFGWGKPVWVSMAKLPDQATNFAILMDSATGDHGVEAWVVLPEKEMSILERDHEFLVYAENNPSVLAS